MRTELVGEDPRAGAHIEFERWQTLHLPLGSFVLQGGFAEEAGLDQLLLDVHAHRLFPVWPVGAGARFSQILWRRLQVMLLLGGCHGHVFVELLGLGELAGSATDVLNELQDLVGESVIGTRGVEAVRALLSGLSEVGVGDDRITLDPSIARGLDYYTGIVLESFLDELPDLGSVCSGGRYDNLAELYTKQSLPGVGASLGIDRLLAGLEELDKLTSVETPASIFLVYFDESHLGDYLRIAARLREHGLSVDFYPEPKKLGQQLKWAGKKGFQKGLVIGSEEFKLGTAQLKDLATQQSTNITWQGDLNLLADAIKNELRK